MEPKETVLSFSARLDEQERKALGWAVVGKGRKSGERGGGVWIVVKDEETELQEIEGEEQGEDLAEIAAAFVRPRGAQEWTAVIGVYVTPSQKKLKYRKATLLSVQRVWDRAREVAREQHLKVGEYLVMGDLNWRMTRKERRALEHGGGEENKTEGEWRPSIDREGEMEDISWEDPVKVGTFSKAEVSIVRGWLESGMTMINGRAPYDKGEATREGSVLDYVLTTTPERVWKLEHHTSRSDHKVTVLRTRDGKEVEQKRQDREKAASDEVRLKDVKWSAWEEEDINRYSDTLAEKLKQTGGIEDVDEREAYVALAVGESACEAEWARLGRVVRGTGDQGGIFEGVRAEKKALLRAIAKFDKQPSRESLDGVQEARKKWKKAWRDAEKKRRKGRTEWWREAKGKEGKAMWDSLQKAGMEGKQEQRAEQVLKPDGSLTIDAEEAAKWTAKWCREVALKDWAEEEGVTFDDDWQRKKIAWEEWRERVAEARWRKEDEEVAAGRSEGRSVMNEICNSDLMSSEMEEGMSKGKRGKAAGADLVPNEAFIVMNSHCQRRIQGQWLEIWRSEECPRRWTESEKRYLDKKAPSMDLDKKRGVSLLSCTGKKYGHSVAARLKLVMGNNVSRVQGTGRGRGCMMQAGGLAQLIGSRWTRGKRTIGVPIDLRKAFDVCDHRMCRAMLQQKGVRGRLLSNVMAKYAERWARVKVKAEGGGFVYSPWWRDRGKGVTQGGVDSMELFAGMVDGLEEALIEAGVTGVAGEEGGELCRLILFADDAILLAECDEDAQKALEVVERFYLRWGMVPNPKKCEVIVWAPGGTTQTPPKLKLIGRELSVKSEIVYLGMHMTKRPTWESHIKCRKKAARKWAWKTCNVARKKGRAPIEVEEVLRKGGERASESYGAELWASLKGKRYEQVWTAQAQTEKKMLGMSQWSPTCLAREESGTGDWAGEVWLRSAELMKNALQNESAGIASVILRERAEKWKKGPGQQEKNEFDWGGRILDEIEEFGGRSLAEKFVSHWPKTPVGSRSGQSWRRW